MPYVDIRRKPDTTRPRMTHVLVVDDEPEALKSMCRLLHAVGYDARGAHGGAEGLAAMRAERPALVLLDLWMANVSGYDVLNAARDDAAIRDVPIVLLSGDHARTRDAVMRLGARDCLAKHRVGAVLAVVRRFVPTS